MFTRYIEAFVIVGVFLLSPVAHSLTANCTISKADAGPYEVFIGGSVSIDLETGNNRMVSLEEDGHRYEHSSIGSEIVSSRKVQRYTCTQSVTRKFSRTNQLANLSFDFYDCEPDRASPQGNSQVDTLGNTRGTKGSLSITQSFDLERKQGIFQEAFSSDGDTWEIYTFHFDRCSLDEQRPDQKHARE